MTTRMDIRTADTTDLDMINRVITNAVMDWQMPERVKRLSLSSYLYDRTDLQHLNIAVAVINDMIVGVLALDNEQSDNTILIHGLFVDPDLQQRGIGTRLFVHAELIAKQQQRTGLLVRAHKDAIRFFNAMGMTKIPVTDQQRDYQQRYYKQIGQHSPIEPTFDSSH